MVHYDYIVFSDAEIYFRTIGARLDRELYSCQSVFGITSAGAAVTMYLWPLLFIHLFVYLWCSNR